jgi:hypothetical protein
MMGEDGGDANCEGGAEGGKARVWVAGGGGVVGVNFPL